MSLEHVSTSDASNCHEQQSALSRRAALKSGLAGGAGLLLADGLRQSARAAVGDTKAKAVIQIWMWGGPSHLDTFDEGFPRVESAGVAASVAAASSKTAAAMLGTVHRFDISRSFQ